MTKETTQPTVAQLKATLKKLGVTFKSKAPRTDLLALLATAQAAQQNAAQPEANRADVPAKIKAKPAAANKLPAKPRSSVKQVIRSKFPSVGDKLAARVLLAACASVKEATIQTMLSDLRNPRYAGKEGVIDVKRDGDDFVRVA
jgi:hypothetical protein